MNDIYDDKPAPKQQVIQEDDFEINPYVDLTDVLNSYVDFDDSVIYFNDDIGERTIVDLMIRFRSLLKYRDSKEYRGKQDAPINLVLN